jgi:hypothetical protein
VSNYLYLPAPNPDVLCSIPGEMSSSTPSPKGVGLPPHLLLGGLVTPPLFSQPKDLLMHPQLAAAAAAAAYSPYFWPAAAMAGAGAAGLPGHNGGMKDVNFNHLQPTPQLSKGKRGRRGGLEGVVGRKGVRGSKKQREERVRAGGREDGGMSGGREGERAKIKGVVIDIKIRIEVEERWERG